MSFFSDTINSKICYLCGKNIELCCIAAKRHYYYCCNQYVRYAFEKDGTATYFSILLFDDFQIRWFNFLSSRDMIECFDDKVRFCIPYNYIDKYSKEQLTEKLRRKRDTYTVFQ